MYDSVGKTLSVSEPVKGIKTPKVHISKEQFIRSIL